MELIRDVLRIEEERGREEVQTLIETEVYLSPSKADIAKVLWTEGSVEILSTKVIRDRLLVSGVLKFKLIYRSGEESDNIYSLDSNVDFKEEIEIMNISEDMSALVKSNIEYIEENLVDERKVSLKALVSLKGVVEEVNNIEIIKGIENGEDLYTLDETIGYREIYGRETSYAFVKEAFEIGEEDPGIEEILKIRLNAFEKEITVVEDRIIISGIVNGRIVYYGDNQIATLEKEIPFNHFLELPGALADSQGDVTIEVVEGGYEVLENEDGDLKIFDLEVKLRISGMAFGEKEKSLIIDAYSTREQLKVEREEINLLENMDNILHREEIFQTFPDYKMKEIYDLSGYPTIIDSRFGEDEIIVEGIIAIQGIYLDEDTGEINTLREELPYRFYLPYVDKKADSFLDTDVELESIKAKGLKGEFAIEALVKHKIRVNRSRKLRTIHSIEGTGEMIDKRNRPSITIYIVQREDRLWDIAKRYNTTVGEILQANESINPSNIMPGEKIIIEKKVDISF